MKKKNGVISFILYVLKKAEANIPKKVEIKVGLVKGNGRRRLDSGNDLTPVNMDCNVDSTDSDTVPLTCSGNGDSSGAGVVILDSDDISGIPLDENSSNPAVVDDLINKKIVKDCSNGCSLPNVTNGKFDDLSSTIYIKGDMDDGIKNSSIFNLSIFPDSYGDCQINTDTKLIECYNKEEIENSQVLIEETVVKDLDGKDLFFLKGGVTSNSDDISLLINDDVHSKEEDTPQTNPSSSSNSTEQTTTTPSSPASSVKKNFNNKANENKGLSGGAIAGIVIACAVAVIVAFLVAYFFKTSGKPPVQQVEQIQMGSSNDIGASVGHFNSSVA